MKRNLIGAISAFILLFASADVFAAVAPENNPGANGYNVFPLLNSLVVNEGTTKTINLYVQNISHSVEQVATVVVDFVAASSNDGKPSLLLNGASTPHGLKQFIKVPNSQFTLQPNQQETVPVSITIPPNTSSGGYFAAIKFAPQSMAANRNVNLNLTGSVASLILVTVPGNLNEDLSVSQFGAGDSAGHIHTLFTNNKNIYGVVEFYNGGNVQLQPFGNFVVRSGHKDVDTVIVNKSNGYVLPGSQRYFAVKLGGIGSFGKYTIYGSFGYGTKGQFLSGSATFYVIPSWLIWLVVAIILSLVLYVIIYLRFVRGRKAKSYHR